MFDLKCYIAVEMDKPTDSPLASLLLGGDPYLEALNHENKTHLGKPLPSGASVEQIELTEGNVRSLLAKLIPSYDPHMSPPVLVTILHDL